MTTQTMKLAAAYALVLVLAACTTTTTVVVGPGITATTTAQPQGGGQPANPVPIVKRAGAITSAVNGQEDIEGDRYAQGDLAGATIPGCTESFSIETSKCLESVEVYTYADKDAQQAGEQRNPPKDGQVTISGPLFDLTVFGVSTDGNTWRYPVSVATIAKRVGGHVLE